jgi:hypothetical protein
VRVGYYCGHAVSEGQPAELAGREKGTFDMDMGVDQAWNDPGAAKVGYPMSRQRARSANSAHQTVFSRKRCRPPLCTRRIKKKGIVKDLHHLI